MYPMPRIDDVLDWLGKPQSITMFGSDKGLHVLANYSGAAGSPQDGFLHTIWGFSIQDYAVWSSATFQTTCAGDGWFRWCLP